LIQRRATAALIAAAISFIVAMAALAQGRSTGVPRDV
jgi:hypothetical protein